MIEKLKFAVTSRIADFKHGYLWSVNDLYD